MPVYMQLQLPLLLRSKPLQLQSSMMELRSVRGGEELGIYTELIFSSIQSYALSRCVCVGGALVNGGAGYSAGVAARCGCALHLP